MAMTVHLTLKANGEDIKGESSVTTLDREDTIECFSFDYGVHSGSESSGRPSGKRNYAPIRVVKRVDQATPLLYKALCDNAAIEGVFRFYRPSPAGDGTTEQFYTVEITQARIAGVDLSSPDATGGAGGPPTETISFVYNNMSQTYESTGVAHQDNWREQA